MQTFKALRSSVVEAAKQISNNLSSTVPNIPGNEYRFGSILVQEEKQLSEGGFAFIWLARDMSTGKPYVLKKIFCQDKERLSLAEREVEILKSLPPHDNIVKYFGHIVEGAGAKKEVIILMEFLPCGHLLDLLNQYNGCLSESIIIQVLIDITKALTHIHTQSPPVQHRDLKIENVMRAEDGRYVVIDLGSCSTSISDTCNLPREEMLKLEDVIERYTTLMYRPPEMVDLYKGYLINTQVDMWMLGCILFTLLCNKHPFQDESKLAIANARFHIDTNATSRVSERLVDLIYWLLAMNPADRPNSSTLLNILNRWSSGDPLPLPAAVLERKAKEQQLYGRRPAVAPAAAAVAPEAAEANWAVWEEAPAAPQTNWANFSDPPDLLG